MRRGDGTLVSETDGLHGSGYAYADVRSGDALYWRLVSPNLYELMRHNNNSEIALPFTAPVPFPVLWSPRADGQVGSEEFIGLLSQPDNTISVNLYFISNGDVFVLEIYRGAMSRYVDWESGIDLRFMIPTIDYDCLNPDPSAQPADVINLCIAELAEYGISADASGLTLAWANQASFARAWTLGELQEILIGVEKVADAFHLLTHEITNPQQSYEYNKEEAKAVFRLIIGDFFVLRVNNALNNGVWTYFKVQGDAQNDSCDGTRIASCTSNIAQAITFYDTISLGVTQYTMVHEIGHRFNARSDGGNGTTPASLFGRMQSARVCEEVTRDNNGNVTNWCGNSSTVRETVVFGRTRTVVDSSQRNIAINNGWDVIFDSDGYYRVQEWVRGNRGWGSGPGTPTNEEFNLVITNYQQHSFHIDDWRTPENIEDADTQEELNDIALRQREVDEATADMFLNWVYRKLSPEEGFRNSSWLGSGCQTENGCDETEPPLNLFPGDRRFEWMNVSMTQIFNQTGTSWR